MKNYRSYILIVIPLMLLIGVGFIADEVLDYVVKVLGWNSAQNGRYYIVSVSIFTLVSGLLRLLTLRGRRIDNAATYLWLIIAVLMIGLGSIWIHITIVQLLFQ